MSLEGGTLFELDPLHHHPGDPEEDDVEARHEEVGRIVAGEVRRLVGPAQRRERPQRRGEPGVQDVGVAFQRDVAAVVVMRRRERLGGSLSATKISRSGPYQAGIWWPYQSCRLMHQGLMLSIQRKNTLAQFGRHETGLAAPHGGRGRGGRTRHVCRNHCSVMRGSITTSVRSPNGWAMTLGSTLVEARRYRLERLDDLVARLEPVEAAEGSRHGVVQARVRRHDVERHEIVPQARPRRSLKSCAGVILTAPVPCSGSACSSAMIGMVRSGQRQREMAPDQVGVARVGGVHRHGLVAEQRLGPGRRRPRRRASGRRRAGSGCTRGGLAPRAISTSRSDTAVRNFGVPVDEPRPAPDQPLAMEVDEDPHHRAW